MDGIVALAAGLIIAFFKAHPRHARIPIPNQQWQRNGTPAGNCSQLRCRL